MDPLEWMGAIRISVQTDILWSEKKSGTKNKNKNFHKKQMYH